jgi:methyl-accepting chemotaxis protein
VNQQTAANAEESASASEEMNTQAELMKDIASELMKLVEEYLEVKSSAVASAASYRRS